MYKRAIQDEKRGVPVAAFRSDYPGGMSVRVSSVFALMVGAAVSLSVGSPAVSAEEALVAAAVRDRDGAAVRRLIREQVDVNAPLGDGSTALHWAAHREDLDSLTLLIDASAQVNAADDYGVTPLWLASTAGSVSIVERLLRAGADPAITLPTGETALMTAARTGRPGVVRLLLEHGSPVNATETVRGQTALMWAAAEGHAEAAQVLIAHGADVHARSTGGYNALLLSARNADLETPRVLLDAGGDVNGAAPDGMTPLAIATIRSRTDLGAYLLERGADPDLGPGFAPLHWASGQWNALADGGVTGRGGVKDEDSAWSILEGLTGETQLEFVKVLLANGADVNTQAEASPGYRGGGRRGGGMAGATPFWIAARAGDVEVMRVLLAHGADPSMATESGVTPLMAAAGVGRGPGNNPVPEQHALEAVRLCLELGNDINAVANGETALHGAAYRGPQGTELLIQFLVDHGAEINVKNKNQWTPLTIVEGLYFTATNTHSAGGAELLLELGAEPSPADVDRQIGTSLGANR